MSKQNANSMFVLFGLTIALALGIHGAAQAQSILERLEQRIRSRIGETDEAAQPAPSAENASPTSDPARASQRSGDTEPGYLGLVADDQDEEGRGVRVLDTRPNGPAAKAGFQKRDLITSVGGIRVRSLADMAEILDLFPPGKVVTFDVLRGQETQRLSATLSQRPKAGTPVAGSTPPPIAPPAPRAEPLPGLPPAGDQSPGRDAAGDAATLAELLRRIEALERRVAELEKATAPE